MTTNNDIREIVKEKYGKIAETKGSCCSGGCCTKPVTADDIAEKLGYSSTDLKNIPEGANLGLGCGNPTAFADIKEGDTVVDFGSGAGIDCFLAAKYTGKAGRVIGIDMTPEMLKSAQKYARENGFENVEFKFGEIENLPIEDNTVDVIISNCVINLSPDKAKVFNEAFRVLKQGGRMFVTDIVLLEELPDIIKEDVNNYVGCISGAALKEDYTNLIKNAGFKKIEILKESPLPYEAVERTGVSQEISEKAAKSVVSIMLKANK